MCLLVVGVFAARATAQLALGPQLGCAPSFSPFALQPAFGARIQHRSDERWSAMLDLGVRPVAPITYEGLFDPRRMLAGAAPQDTTVRTFRSTHRTLPLSLTLGATWRMGRGRRSVTAHRYVVLAVGVHHVLHRRTWSSDGVYSGTHEEGDDRWSTTGVVFAPGIGHRTRVHGRKRYHVELRPGLERSTGDGRNAEVTGWLGLLLGVTWGL
ncbi:MAG: hypothetical protein JNL05_09425 [Flavobacteriales bacterium]|nr:hypothetical protein [Flavobacteriales bacterium]